MQQLTAEEKARVFAMYLGSKMIDYSNVPFKVEGANIDALHTGFGQSYKLILRPISKISDEDAIEVCRLADNTIDTDHVLTEKDKKNLVKGMNEAMNEGEFPYHIADFLRSRSYALPYHGIDLFEAGIAIEQP